MRLHRFWAGCALLLLSLAAGRAAAQSGGLSLQVDQVDTAGFPDVTLAVTVRDANGVPVPDLAAGNFEILEAMIDQPRPIAEAVPHVNPDAQVSVILVLDISGSMAGQPLADARAAAVQFIAQLSAADQAALLAFADTVDFDQVNPDRELDFTPDKAQLLSLLDGLSAGGATPLYDALFKAVRLADRADLGHRAVLLLTDGVDEDSNGRTPGSRVASSDTPIQAAQQANIPIFTVGLGTQIDAGYLERLARATGGDYQFAPASSELQTTFQNVAERLKQQYLVTYASGYDCDGQSHRIEVRVETAGRSATDSAGLGPLPDQPGCNPQAVPTAIAAASTATPAPPVPAATAVQPPPTATATTVPATPVTQPTAIPGGGSPTSGTIHAGLIIGGILGVLLLVLAYLGWRRRSRPVDVDRRP